MKGVGENQVQIYIMTLILYGEKAIGFSKEYYFFPHFC
mgnify:CR=1 FL=1|jgi:hypothetical protein